MQQTEQTETRKDLAFHVHKVNIATGETTIVIQKGIIGPLSNQLKNTSDRRKGASILRKLGYDLSACGDIQYGGNVEETDLDPALITDEPHTENE